MTEINPKPGDYNDGYKAMFSGVYVFSPSDEWVALASALPGEVMYRLNANNKENRVSFENVAVDKYSDPITYKENNVSDESISLQDRAIAAVDAAIEDAFERGYATGLLEDEENRGTVDYDLGFEAGAAEADKVQYNRGYETGIKEERERYAEARAAISNSSAELAELQKATQKVYDTVRTRFWDAKEGSKAEASLEAVLYLFENDDALGKALND